jgi:hypothetical protein
MRNCPINVAEISMRNCSINAAETRQKVGGADNPTISRFRVTILGEISPFGRCFLALGEILPKFIEVRL